MKIININEALSKIKWEYAAYFRFKFPELQFDQTKKPKTDDEFLKSVKRDTFNAFLRWERTEEYKALSTLYLSMKAMKDYEAIYQIVSEKALQGDEKMVKTFLTLQKDINSQVNIATKLLVGNDEFQVEDLDDGLVI